jgi:hypothetical protein
MGRTASYVLDLLDEILGESGQREKRFPWALGDQSPTTGRGIELPFDSYWPARRLIVEIDEDQHRTPTPFFDKPHVVTVSGVSRGEQRRIYDARKRAAARAQGFTIVEIPWPRKPPLDRRDRDQDRGILVQRLQEAGVEI